MKPHPAKSDVFTMPALHGFSRECPIGEHRATSLPRWTAYHKGKFTKNGTAIVKTTSERKHITKASGGRYVFD